MNKLKMWNGHSSWESAESLWDGVAARAAEQHPIKQLTTLPDMPGITDETARHLKWRSLKWMFSEDQDFQVIKELIKHPFKYTYRYLRSLWKGKSYKRDGDFFLYGVQDADEFASLIQNDESILVVGFSYCHKPFECPSGRFTDQCIHDANHPVCQQCFIGKCFHALPDHNVITLFIPTVNYIGKKIFEVVHAYPKKKVYFLITACEMTLEMFGDFGNMVGIRGIGVRLDGRICNTMKAFELSEKGVKPGLTVVLEPTKERILNLIRSRRASSSPARSDTNA